MLTAVHAHLSIECPVLHKGLGGRRLDARHRHAGCVHCCTCCSSDALRLEAMVRQIALSITACRSWDVLGVYVWCMHKGGKHERGHSIHEIMSRACLGNFAGGSRRLEVVRASRQPGCWRLGHLECIINSKLSHLL